jgi:hypothetical protein
VRVSEQSKDGGGAKGSNLETGVLANLPRTRPQRSSARRAAAREAARAHAKAKPGSAAPANTKSAKAEPMRAKPAQARTAKTKPAKTKPAPAGQANAMSMTPPPPLAKATPAKARPANARPTKVKRAAGGTGVEETVPRQGFEVDGDIASGSVQPPGAAELVSSAAELAGELAKAGVTGGARLLKDLFARLPPG